MNIKKLYQAVLSLPLFLRAAMTAFWKRIRSRLWVSRMLSRLMTISRLICITAILCSPIHASIPIFRVAVIIGVANGRVIIIPVS